MDSTDKFFPSVKSTQWCICSQFFVASDLSNTWDVHPLKLESQNIGALLQALQNHCQYKDIPGIVWSDNAPSNKCKSLATFIREHCIEGQTSFPDGAHTTNPAERNIGYLCWVDQTSHQEYQIPVEHHHWVQKCCCWVHNVASSWKPSWLYHNVPSKFPTSCLLGFMCGSLFDVLIIMAKCHKSSGRKDAALVWRTLPGTGWHIASKQSTSVQGNNCLSGTLWSANVSMLE